MRMGNANAYALTQCPFQCLEVRSKERIPPSRRTPPHRTSTRNSPRPHPRTAPSPSPSIMFNPSAADRHPRTRARERRQQQQPTHEKPTPQGAANMPIPAPAHKPTPSSNIVHRHPAPSTTPWPDGTAQTGTTPPCVQHHLRRTSHHPAPYGDIVIALSQIRPRQPTRRVPSFMFDALADWHATRARPRPRTPCGLITPTRTRPLTVRIAAEPTTSRPASAPAELRSGRHLNIPDTLETAMSRERPSE